MHQPAATAPSRFAAGGRGGAGARDLVRVTDRARCPVCGKGKKCRVDLARRLVQCDRVSVNALYSLPEGKGLGPTWVHALDGATVQRFERAAPPNITADHAGPEDLDRAYRALLARLRLDAGDRAALLARGLSAEQVNANGYRTHPPGWRERAPIARELVTTFGEDLARRVPGIVWCEDRADSSRGWWSLAGYAGILVPCRDLAGRIVALKVRRRDPCDGARYLYCTSAPAGGPSALSALHVPAAALALRGKVEPLVLTEGELKADVSTALSDLPVASIAGVGQWRAGVDLARQWGARTVAVALDADALEVEAVARAQHALVRALRREGLDVQLWQWPAEQGKGLNDFLRGRSATGG